MGIIALDKQLTFVEKLLRCFFFEKKTDQTKSSEKKNDDDEEFEFSFIFIRNIMRFPQ